MTIYNEKYISLFDVGVYDRVLNDINILDKIKNVYVNKYCNPKDGKYEAKDILFKESLDHYVLKKLNEDSNFIDSPQVYNYIKYIYSIYNDNPLEFSTNIILLDSNIKSKLFKKYFSNKQADLIENRINKNEELFDSIIKKIRSEIKISQDELDFVCEYMAKLRNPRIREYEDILKYIFGPMRDSDLKFSYKVQDAVLSYLPYFYGSSVTDVRYVLADTDRGVPIKGPGHSASDGNYIALNKKYFENVDLNSIENSNVERLRSGDDITFFMIVAFHEITHQVQKNASKYEGYNDFGMGMIIRNLLNRKNKDYTINHDSDEIEINANKNGWSKCSEFYSKYYEGKDKGKLLGNCAKNTHTSDFRRYFAYKKGKDGNYLPYYEYDIVNLIHIIREKPSILDEYPMLKKFFSKEGRLKKNFIFDFDIYTSSTSKEYINYFYEHNGIEAVLSYLDNNKLSGNQVTYLLNNLYYYIKYLLRSREAFDYVLTKETIGEYTNNEKFNREVADKLYKVYYEKSLRYYKQLLPLLKKISKLYPNSAGYVDFIISHLNNDLNVETNFLYEFVGPSK